MNRSIVAVLVVCLCGAYVLMSALTELTASTAPAQSADEYATLTSIEPLAKNNDLKVKSAKGKYRYKTESGSDAEQTWAVTAETPTSYSSFEQISTIRMRGRKSGNPDSLDHQFNIKTSGITAGGTVYKGRFYPWDNFGSSQSKSGGSEHKFAAGLFKAKIVPDGASGQYRMIFLYAITSASRAGEIAETNRFDEMKAALADVGKTNGVINTEYAMTINGLEQHDGASEAKFKASTKNGTGKLVKTPPAAAQ